MKTRGILWSVCFLALLEVPLAGQPAPGADAIPNWPAPSFWEPPAFGRSAGISGDEADAGVSVLAATASPMPFVPITPCRVVDTRGNGFIGAYGPPALVGNGLARNFNIPAGPCPGIPAGAGASTSRRSCRHPMGS